MKSPPLIIICCFFTWVAALGAQKPNFILIMADDLGWGDLSSSGQAHSQTPERDRLRALPRLSPDREGHGGMATCVEMDRVNFPSRPQI